jgi:hypothetical protein
MIQMDVVVGVLSPFRNFDENNAEQSKLHQLCSEWFVRHISKRVQESAAQSESLLGRVGVANISTICRSLRSLLTVVSDAPDTSINTVLNHWGGELLSLLTPLPSLNQTTSSEGEQNNALLAQATFLFLGWLSMIYEPKLFPAEGRLEILLPRSAQTSPRFRRQRQVPTDSLDISSASHLAFPHLFASFGQRLPQMSNDPAPDPDSTIQGRQAGVLVASNVFYSNLHRIGRIKIQWVNDVVHHLEFDERNRILSLFAFPTYCSLVCLSEPASTRPLSR